MSGPSVLRPSVDTHTLQLSFSARVNRRQRKSDGTITLNGVRFEIPNHLRTLDSVTIRYRNWDLSFATIVDERTNAELAKIRPIDKQKNADGFRRPLSEPGAASYPEEIKDSEQVAPLLEQMLADYSATGLPPAYLPKNETSQSNQDIEKGEQ
jgi:putative transposase